MALVQFSQQNNLKERENTQCNHLNCFLLILVYSFCSSTGSKVITKQSMFFGRRYLCTFFFPVGLSQNKTLRLGCLNVSSFNQQQVSSQLHFQVQIPFFLTYPSVVPNSNLHFFFVNSQLDALPLL